MDFLFAIARNDIEKVKRMSQSGIDVNNSFSWNSKDTYSPVIPKDIMTKPDLLSHLQIDEVYQCKPLNLAVIGGYTNMVRLLLSAGADINSKDGRGRTALVCAIYGLDLNASNINTSNLHLISQTNTFHFNIMKTILLCHPNLTYTTLDSPQYEIKGITPLCLASYLGKADIMQLLLDDGRVNVDGTDSKEATALMYAARDGNVPIVKILLSYNASSDLTDSHGWSAIQYAERNVEIVQLCEVALRKRRSEIPVLCYDEDTIHKYPINHLKLSNLINTIPSYPSSLSHLQFEDLKDLNYGDPSAAPIINMIQSAFLQAIKSHDFESLHILLMQSPFTKSKDGEYSHGPLLVNYHDPKTGLTAIHHAVRARPLPSLDTITILYQAGADMNAQTYYGRTALHHLARFGADKDGKTWGIQKNGNSKPVNSSAVKIDQKHVPQHLAKCASLLIQFGALVNITDPTGNTPLHFATEFGGVPDVLDVLMLEGGADLTVQNKKGHTPVDLCKSDEIRKRLILLDQDRKQGKSQSLLSTYSSTIRPFDSASEYNGRFSIPYSNHRTTKNGPMSTSHLFKDSGKRTSKKDFLEDENGSNAQFELILRAFFNYQTVFTDSIESSLGYITELILRSYNLQEKEQITTVQQVEKSIFQLRYELRETHEKFDVTDQKVEKVMLSFREELEQVEQIHQSDWELSKLHTDKIEKLFDVHGRIDNRFSQLNLIQDDLLDHVEKLRKLALRKQQQASRYDSSGEHLQNCISHLIQTFAIFLTVPIDQSSFAFRDYARLYQEIKPAVEEVIAAVENIGNGPKRLEDTYKHMIKYWQEFKERYSNDKDIHYASIPRLSQSINQFKQWKKQLKLSNLFYLRQKGPSLNQLELSFDICHSNLHEIKKDLEEVMEQIESIMKNKKQMYDLCLKLEKELSQKQNSRSEAVIRSELIQVLSYTQQLFEKQSKLDMDKAELIKEYKQTEQKLEETKSFLMKVRPPALLIGLLDRLDTDDVHHIKIEKDWREDAHLVAEIVIDKEYTQDNSYFPLTLHHLEQLDKQCSSKLSTLCYIARLNASLFCLKVIVGSLIKKSQQSLSNVHTALGKANVELDESKIQMTQLYDNAAEVARQVFALKIELETIVRHRKEEVVKVWKVVDEVSEGVDWKSIENTKEPSISNKMGHTSPKKDPGVKANVDKKKSLEDRERHDWIIRELEQLKHIYESLQDQIQELKRDQAMINDDLKQLAVTLIEPQVDLLVGKNNNSLLFISDRIEELMEHIKMDQYGLMVPWSAKASLVSATSFTSKKLLSKSSSNLLSSTSSNTIHNDTVPSPKRVSQPKHKRISSIVSNNMDQKPMTIISNTSLSSLSSYHPENMMKQAAHLSDAWSSMRKHNRKL